MGIGSILQQFYGGAGYKCVAHLKRQKISTRKHFILVIISFSGISRVSLFRMVMKGPIKKKNKQWCGKNLAPQLQWDPVVHEQGHGHSVPTAETGCQEQAEICSICSCPGATLVLKSFYSFGWTHRGFSQVCECWGTDREKNCLKSSHQNL